MKKWISIISLSWFMALSPAYADEIKDVDQWAADFMVAAGKTDTNAMTELIRPYTKAGMDQIEQLNKSIMTVFGSLHELYAEQFNPGQLGTFMRRINIAVIYDDRQMYYSIFFIRRADGWLIYYYAAYSSLSEIVKLTWP